MGKNKESFEEFEILENKKIMEADEIVIYRDIDDLGRVFVTASTLKRFHLPFPMYKLILDTKEELYEIKPQEAIYIIEHTNNSFAPYTIHYQNFDFNNELIDEKQKGRRAPASDDVVDELIIYRDVDDSSKAFVGIDVLTRFHLEKPANKVLIGDVIVYEIDPVLAINIINNSSNKFAPYKIRYVSIQFDHVQENELGETVSSAEQKPEQLDRVMPYIERPELLDRIMPYKDPREGKKDKKKTTQHIRRPRPKKPTETDVVYAAYLEGFYDSLFGYDENAEKANSNQPDTPVSIEGDTTDGQYDEDHEYLAYLKDYYHRMFKQEALDKLQPKNLIRKRERRHDETAKEYQQYLKMFYGEPTEEETKGRAK